MGISLSTEPATVDVRSFRRHRDGVAIGSSSRN
jgi:hypothetical protein